MAVATLLAVIAALFLDDVRALLHRPEVQVRVHNELMQFAHNKWYVRGTVTNTGDRRAKRCRVKLLRIEGEPDPLNAYLPWQGGIRDFMTIYPGEHWIFDIGTRDPAKNTLLLIDAYIGTNLVRRTLTPRESSYTLVLAVYGNNILSPPQRVSLRISAEPNDIEIS
jgi:hypothetical protein